MYELSDIVWLGPMVIILPILGLIMIYKISNPKVKAFGDPALSHDNQ